MPSKKQLLLALFIGNIFEFPKIFTSTLTLFIVFTVIAVIEHSTQFFFYGVYVLASVYILTLAYLWIKVFGFNKD